MGARLKRWMAACTAATLLAACGGDGGGPAPAPVPVPVVPASAGAATLDTDGGKVTGEGAEILIPPAALTDTVTIRIARDSSGAPPLPAWVRSAGDMLSLTPHGAAFAEPVTVRLAAPNLTLQPNERLMIAKAQPGGSWEVLGDTELKDGKLEAQVTSFSYFLPVVVTYVLPPQATLLPFDMNDITLTCDDQPCPSPILLGDVQVFAQSSGNGGVLPQGCVNPRLYMTFGSTAYSPQIGEMVDASPTVVMRRNTSLAGRARGSDTPTVAIFLRCIEESTNALSYQMLAHKFLGADTFPRFPTTPTVRAFPTTLTLAEGASGSLKAILVGGPSVGTYNSIFPAPTAGDQAIVHFEKLAPNETVWRTVSQIPQTQADPQPTGYVPWAYWGFDFTVGPVGQADNGAQYRVRACYQPPNGQTSCRSGPAALLTVVQQTTVPSFAQQPQSLLVQPGETASFSAVVGGIPAPALRWQTRASSTADWADVQGGSGADTPNYTTPVVTLADNGRQYRLLATNSAASVGSDAATLSVSAAPVPPSIVAQPASLSVVAGSEALFAVTAQGTAALSYQWLRNGTAIVGANGSQLKLPSVTAADAAVYAVRVSNAVGEVRSQDALLAVTDVPSVTPVAPTIVTQPAAVAVTEGNTATFAVGAQGTGPLAFQWLRNGAIIDGATAAAYTLPAAAMADAGNYSVRVSNAAGAVTSQTATLAVVPTVVPPAEPPVIVRQPGGVVVAPGMSALLGVTLTGSGPMQFQWYRDGTALPGSTQAIHVIDSASAQDAGSYHVVASNAAGSAQSQAAAVLLLGAPVITTQPSNASVAEGASATFGVVATGDHLRYQWTRNGVAVAGAAGANYTTPATTAADNGAVFAVIVYNGAGLVVSNGAVLTLSAPSPSQWQPSVPVESNPADSAQFPQIAANAMGVAVAVWQQAWTGPPGIPAISIWASRYTPADGWEAPQPISDGTNSAQNAQVAVDADGNAIAVWQQSDNFRDSIWAARYTTAGGWTAPHLIEGSDGNAGNAQIAVDGAGNAIAVWWQNTSAAPGSPIGTVANRFVASSGWSGAAAISSHAGNGGTYGPQIAFDAAGNAMATWCWSGATAAQHMWAARYSAAGSWSEALAIDHENSTGCSASPNVAFDSAGNAIAVWHRNNGSFDQVRTNRYSVATGWGTAGWLTAAPPNYSRNARVAFDAGGDAIAVWEQQVGATANAHVMASRWRSVTGWDEPVSIKTDANGSAFGPLIVVDPAGNATVTWYQRDALNILFNVWAHRYQPAGGWGGAVQIDGHSQNAQRPALAVDAAGRVTVVWEQNVTAVRRNIWTAGYR